MDLYIERENDMITLEEWREYIDTDRELCLNETGSGINPITKKPLCILSPGNAVWIPTGDEIRYKDGRVGCEGGDRALTEKLINIAKALSADVFDCGEKITQEGM